MINDFEKGIILLALNSKFKNGEDIAPILRSYSNLNIDEREAIYKEITNKPYPATLDEVKEYKISTFSEICNSIIEKGVDVEIDGKKEHFSYTIKNGDQTNIDNLVSSVKFTGLSQPYHSDGGNCKMYTPAQVIAIYIACITNKTKQTTYFNQMKRFITEFFTDENQIDDLRRIQYGDQLVGEYLTKFVQILQESQTIINAFINNIGAGLLPKVTNRENNNGGEITTPGITPESESVEKEN